MTAAIAAIGGALWMCPGAACPGSLRSTRPAVVGRLTRGADVTRAASIVGALFSVCGHAHRRCAELAIAAASGRDAVVDETAHAQQTLREHLRWLWADGPRYLGVLLAAPPPLDAAGWLGEQVAMPWADWLAGWSRDPQDWLTDWSRDAGSPLARWVRDVEPIAGVALPTVAPLRVHERQASLRAWAAQRPVDAPPRWEGACAETGVWSRLREPDPSLYRTPWLRIGARIAEALRLALPGPSPLACGAISLAEGEGLAWIEMSRGLLIHHVRLDAAARVAAYDVIAPTDWNAHPEGGHAQALARMRRDDPRLGALAAAYDPCVPCHLVEAPALEETLHA